MSTAVALRGASIVGVIGGTLMATFMMVVDLVSGFGFWYTPSLLSTLFLREEVISHGFQWGPLALGLLIHLPTSLVFGVVGILGVRQIISRLASTPNLDVGTRLVIGVLFGVALFLVMMHLALRVLQPRIAHEVSYVPFLIAHGLYGFVLGLYPTPRAP